MHAPAGLSERWLEQSSECPAPEARAVVSEEPSIALVLCCQTSNCNTDPVLGEGRAETKNNNCMILSALLNCTDPAPSGHREE